MNTSSYDTIIIGGGIIGATLAYRLAERKKRVLVLEKNRLGSGATQAGAGMLGAQVEMKENGPLYQFGLYSRSLFEQFSSELYDVSHIDIELDRSGLFRVATSMEDRDELMNRFTWQTESGQMAEWMEPHELPQQVKSLLGNHFGALYFSADHQVRNPQYLHASVVASQKLGATYIEHCAVQSFIREEGPIHKVIGVQTLTDRFYADQVVVAAGAWSGKIAESLGLSVDVFPVKGQALNVKNSPHLTPYTLYTHGAYLVPKHTGHTYIGATEDLVGFDLTPRSKNVQTLLHLAQSVVPKIGETEFASTLVGLRPGTKDGLPYIGAHPDWEGLYLATGHFRNGILLSAGTASVMADLLTGQSPMFDLKVFATNRKN